MDYTTFYTTIRRGFPVKVRIITYVPPVTTRSIHDPGEMEIRVETVDGRDASFLRLTDREIDALHDEALDHLPANAA